jgi:hypothetical protein
VAQRAKTQLEALCDTSVVISRDASQDFVPRGNVASRIWLPRAIAVDWALAGVNLFANLI